MQPVKPKRLKPKRHGPALFPILTTLTATTLLVLAWGERVTPAEDAAPADKAKPAAPAKELDGWRAPKEARAVPNPVKPAPESVARGKTAFEKTCLKCHGAEGHGDGKMAKALAAKPADLTLRLPPQSDGEIFWKITEGKSPMPSFKKDLTPEQRWDVVNYLRQVILAPKTPAKADSAKPSSGSGGS
jgi:mono/diheme cytochrome c family protein